MTVWSKKSQCKKAEYQLYVFKGTCGSKAGCIAPVISHLQGAQMLNRFFVGNDSEENYTYCMVIVGGGKGKDPNTY